MDEARREVEAVRRQLARALWELREFTGALKEVERACDCIKEADAAAVRVRAALGVAS